MLFIRHLLVPKWHKPFHPSMYVLEISRFELGCTVWMWINDGWLWDSQMCIWHPPTHHGLHEPSGHLLCHKLMDVLLLQQLCIRNSLLSGSCCIFKNCLLARAIGVGLFLHGRVSSVVLGWPITGSQVWFLPLDQSLEPMLNSGHPYPICCDIYMSMKYFWSKEILTTNKVLQIIEMHSCHRTKSPYCSCPDSFVSNLGPRN